MRLRVSKSTISGQIPASPSKSYTHRAMVLAMLSPGLSRLTRVLFSDDTLSTLNAIRQFGAGVSVEGDTCSVEGGELDCPEETVDAGNSGTTIRLLAGAASLLPCTTVLTGDSSLRRRPMGPLVHALNELEVKCMATQAKDRAPLMIRGPNRGRKAHIRGDVSSQFISSLLLSSPPKNVDTDLILTTPLKSRPYVDITLEMMESFGAVCEPRGSGYHVPGCQRYVPVDYRVPGDFSSAAFPLVAGALTGRVRVTGLTEDTCQADRVILDILRQFQARVMVQGDSVEVEGGELRGGEVDLGNSPDLFPIVAVLATQARGESRLFNAAHLRHKESDRIAATVSFLREMGALVRETRDGCVVSGPCGLRGAEVVSHGDHRILMAAAVAGMVAQGDTIIDEGKCYSVSYPTFLQDLRSLGAEMELIG
ncbi:MAG: 3-phosphoshikimate 1-carboxyvinyltransferase [Methanomassiliicoccales archaeon]